MAGRDLLSYLLTQTWGLIHTQFRRVGWLFRLMIHTYHIFPERFYFIFLFCVQFSDCSVLNFIIVVWLLFIIIILLLF